MPATISKKKKRRGYVVNRRGTINWGSIGGSPEVRPCYREQSKVREIRREDTQRDEKVTEKQHEENRKSKWTD